MAVSGWEAVVGGLGGRGGREGVGVGGGSEARGTVAAGEGGSGSLVMIWR